MQPALLMIGVLVVLLTIGAPIFVGLGVAALVAFVAMGAPADSIAQIFVSTLSSYALLAIPLFVLLAELMSGTGMVTRLVSLLGAFVGQIRGGLGVVAVLTSAIFAAFSGSSPANAAALGVALMPQLVRSGYDARFAAGLLAAGGTLGILIPPSINMIIYSAVTDLPVLDLFRAGVIPGLILSSFFLVLVIFESHRRKIPLLPPVSWRERWRAIRTDGPLLLLPVVVLGAIYSGMVAVTESAVIGVVFALALQALWYRQLSLKMLYEVLVRTAKTTAMIFLIIGTAATFAHVLTLTQVPQYLAADIGLLLNFSRAAFFATVVLFLIVLGAFIDVAAITFIAVPLLDLALAMHGLDRVQFAIMFVITMELGLISPPIGLNTFILSSVSGLSIKQVMIGAIPFCIAMLLAIALVALVPALTLQ